jgi:hypothetical protein
MHEQVDRDVVQWYDIQVEYLMHDDNNWGQILMKEKVFWWMKMKGVRKE